MKYYVRQRDATDFIGPHTKEEVVKLLQRGLLTADHEMLECVGQSYGALKRSTQWRRIADTWPSSELRIHATPVEQPVTDTRPADALQKSGDSSKEMRTERPGIVVIISWLLGLYVVFSGLVLLGITATTTGTIPEAFILAILIDKSIQLALAIGIYKGHNWARIIFFFYFSVALALNILTGMLGIEFVVQLLVYGVIAYWLTLKEVRVFFGGSVILLSPADSEESWPRSRDRIAFGVLVLFVMVLPLLRRSMGDTTASAGVYIVQLVLVCWLLWSSLSCWSRDRPCALFGLSVLGVGIFTGWVR